MANTIETDAQYQRAWREWMKADHMLSIHPLKPELRVLYTAEKKAARAKMDDRQKALEV